MSEYIYREFMLSMGLDIQDKELHDTPRRVVDSLKALISEQNTDISQFFDRPLPTKHSEMVVFNNIKFVSVCPHHLMPFFGKAYIAYIPDRLIAGFSKFPSAVQALARRPILQETFTSTLADVIEDKLNPIGVMVIVIATHTCTVVPGEYDYNSGVVQQPLCQVATSAVRGLFAKDIPPYSREAARNEALNLMKLKEVKI